jgi:hypothetical protein
MTEEIKARVFISCGQRKDSEEENIANDIKANIEKIGYEPYVAIKEQVSKGLKENIFQRLEKSEYFIFIDFKREKIGRKIGKKKYRGSLFANQELAIASYIELPIIAFQESGVKERDGILDVIQANPEKFVSRSELAKRVIEVVKEKTKNGEWSPNWRNELFIDREDTDFEEANYSGDPNQPTRFFHVRVYNRHISQVAWKCLCYIEKIIDLSKNEEVPLEIIELKWRGIGNIEIQIPPSANRKFDAIFIDKNHYDLARIGFNRSIVDYYRYNDIMILNKPGKYLIKFVAFSENFLPARAGFICHLENDIDSVKLIKDV